MKALVTLTCMSLTLIGAWGVVSLHAEAPPPQGSRINELERKLDLLSAEIERMKLGEAVTAEHTSSTVLGLAPAAAKVYHVKKGVSLGGYGEMVYENLRKKKEDGTSSGKKNQLDFVRFILYAGYKFTDKLLLNSEVEIEHATTDDNKGEAAIEFAYLDYRWTQPLGFRAGLLLIPMGFLNELHEPPVFHGAKRPNVERNVIPTTWRENGVGIAGEVGPLAYRSYVVAGLRAIKNDDDKSDGFSADSGIRKGRTDGSKSRADDLAWVGRLDYVGVPRALVGASLYTGKSGQRETNAAGDEIGARVTLWDLHGQWEWRGLELRGLYGRVRVNDVSDINAKNGLTGNKSVGEKMFGGYLQVAYDLLSLTGSKQSLAPFFRYERYNTQQVVPAGFASDPGNDRIEYTWGATYKPITQAVLKLDYQVMQNRAKTGVNQFNLGVGYLF